MLKPTVEKKSVEDAHFLSLKKALNLVKGHPVLTPFGEGGLLSVEKDFCLVKLPMGTNYTAKAWCFTFTFEAGSMPVKIETINVWLKEMDSA